MKTMTAPSTTIHIFTGNNIGPRGDMSSRSGSVRLTEVEHRESGSGCFETGIGEIQRRVAPRRGRPRWRGGGTDAAPGGGVAFGSCWTSGGRATPTALNTPLAHPGA